MNKTLTALNGIKVGHSTHIDKLTGTTVVFSINPILLPINLTEDQPEPIIPTLSAMVKVIIMPMLFLSRVEVGPVFKPVEKFASG